MASSQGFQAHDMIPVRLAKEYINLFKDYLPGWSVRGEYNYTRLRKESPTAPRPHPTPKL